MRTLFDDFLAQLKGIWSRLDGGQRLVVASVLLATVVGLGAMMWFAGQPSYVTVMTAQSSEDLVAAQRALDQASIAYRPAGRSIEVDRSRAKEAQTALIGAGLTTSKSSSDVGMSSIIDDAETKAWKLNNASIAKAKAAVSEISGVRGVNITAAPPKKRRAFVDKDHESRPSATVLLLMRPGADFQTAANVAADLTKSQLGIPKENVTVSDAVSGRTWNYDPNRAVGGGSSEFLSLERSMSDKRTARAQEVLDSMWPNKTTVVVTVELDPKWEIVSEKVRPETELVSSEEKTKETSETANPTTGQDSSASASSDSTKNEITKREFVTEIGERRSGQLRPEIRRLNVAVLYDRSLEEATGFDKQELIKTVKSMVGWDKERDTEDSFSVMPGDFEPIDIESMMTAGPGMVDLALRWGPAVGQILGVLVVVLFLRGLFKKSGKQQTATQLASVAAESAPEREHSAEEMQRRMRHEIERAIASDPASLAKLLETWLVEQGV